MRGSKNKLIDYKNTVSNDPHRSNDDDNEDYISSDEDEQAAENWEPLPL